MATWFAQNSSVNIDSVNQWNSAANGSGSWLTWASLGASDVLVANGKTNITVNVNVTCASIRNTTLSGATSGGTMICSTAVTITCDLYSVTGVQLLTLSHTTGNTVAIVGNLFGADVGSVNYTVRNTSTGSLTITGNLATAGTGGGCLECTGNGTMTITGNVTGCGSTNITMINLNSASCTLNVTGNVTGGSGSFTRAINVSAGTLVVTGAVAGGGGSGVSSGIYSTATQALTVIGDCTAGSANAAVLIAYSGTSATPCQFNHTGNMIAETNGYPGVAFAGKYLIHSSNTLTHTYRVNNSGSAGSARSLYTGGTNLGQPSTANVRIGTVFGASNEYTGTLAVPSASLVAIGVSVDNTTGTFLPNPQVLQQTTIATLASQTSFTLTAGSADNDVYNGQTLIIQDASTSTQKAVGTVLDYVGATKTITLTADPAIFTMAVGDSVSIVAGAGSSGGGSTDWDATERSQIRHRLGIDGTTAAPSASPSLASPTNITAGTITTVTTLTGHTPQTGDSFARIGATGSGLTSLSTQTSVDDLPTNAELATALGTADDAVLAAIATVQSDTNDIQTRLPAALESGRIAAALDSAAILAVADQVWDEATSGHTTAGTYGGRIVRATNSNTEVQITGSNHIAADIHDLQSGVITAGDFAANSITASALATDAVTEIQSGLATSAALATESTKLNRIEAVATGTVTGAGTSTEVFVGPSATLTITVDSSGNRSAVVVT